MPKRLITKLCATLCLSMSFILVAPVPSIADDDHVRPGLTNPVMNPNRWTLFRDDEAVVFVETLGVEGDNVQALSMAPTSGALDDWDTEEAFREVDHQVCGADHDRFSVATGRMTRLEYDQTVRVYIDSNADAVVELVNGNSTVAWTKILEDPGVDSQYRRVRVAVGDMDYARDDDGNYHDEIAVARLYKTEDRYKVVVTVLNYQKKELGSSIASHRKEITDIRMEVGDFDGDDLLELAIVNNYIDDEFSIVGFWYEPDAKIVTHGDQVVYMGQGDDLGYDTAAGDYNGDGKDDLVLYNYSLSFFQADEYMTFSRKHETYSLQGDPDGRVVSGLFYMNPDDGYGINRRQLALVTGYNFDDMGPEGLLVDFYRVKSDFDLTWMHSYSVVDDEVSNYAKRYLGYDLAPGNFVGHGDDNLSPIMQLALSYVQISIPLFSYETDAYYKKESKVRIVEFHSGAPESVYSLTSQSHEVLASEYSNSPHMATTMVALDLDGDTYRLGAPVRISVENFLSMDVLLEEPPKHVDFLPDDPLNWDGSWSVFISGAYPQHYVGFESEEETELSSESISTTNATYGVSLAVSAETSQSVGTGVNAGALSVGVKAKAGYDYEEHKEKYESEYHSKTSSILAKTSNDDILFYKYQDIDIWRYRVIGLTTDKGENVYQDIVMPGAKYSRRGNGTQHMDWYCPLHINKNLLSYPDMNSDFPSDVGKYEVLGEEKQGVMTPKIVYDYSGGSTLNPSLSWTDASGNGETKEHSSTLTTSAEVYMAYKGSVGIPDVSKTETKGKVDLSFHSKNVWSKSEITTENTTSTNAVSVSIPDIDLPSPEWNYSYLPVVYVSSAGGELKCAHGVDRKTLFNAWGSYYGGRPDPALNLPLRFEFHREAENQFGSWSLVTDDYRMSMRGMFLRKNELDPVSGEYELYAGSPTDGDLVRLGARIYNLSTGMAVTPKVRFEYALINTVTNTELEDVGRVVIGETTTGVIDPLATEEAQVIWNTNGLSQLKNPETGKMDSTLALRLYVVIDPDNEVENEIHEWKDEDRAGEEGWADEEGRLYHGNNEGYYPEFGGIFIHPGSSDDKGLAENTYTQAILNVHDESLGIETPNQGILTSGIIFVKEGETYRLRAHIEADVPDDIHRPLFFYDEDPENTDEILDMVTLRGVRKDNYVWSKWTPTEAGDYELWTVLLDKNSKESDSSTSDYLHVTVLTEKQWDVVADDKDSCFVQTLAK